MDSPRSSFEICSHSTDLSFDNLAAAETCLLRFPSTGDGNASMMQKLLFFEFRSGGVSKELIIMNIYGNQRHPKQSAFPSDLKVFETDNRYLKGLCFCCPTLNNQKSNQFNDHSTSWQQ